MEGKKEDVRCAMMTAVQVIRRRVLFPAICKQGKIGLVWRKRERKSKNARWDR
jgi:hypothetical protein